MAVRRCLAGAALGLALLAGAAPAALAQNFDLDVPLQLTPDGPPLTGVPVRITADQTVLFEVDAFVAVMRDTLTAAIIRRIEELDPDPDGRVTLADIQTAGVPMTFDSSRVVLLIDPASTSLLPTPLVVSGRRADRFSGYAEEAAGFSAFVNVRPVYEYVHGTGEGEHSWTFRGGFDGAAWVRTGDWIGDFALVGAGQYTVHDAAQRWSREFTRLVFDMPDDANRLTLGDLNYRGTGFQTVPRLGGVSFAREFGLQPERLRAVGGGRVFELAAESDVDIYLNDQRVFSRRLPAGRFELDDLGFIAGANDVRIEATDLVGRTETIVIDAFYDSRLLPADELDFGVALGLISQVNEGVLQYDGDTRFLTGFAEYGFGPELTMGANGQVLFGQDLRWQIGFTADAATFLGSFGLRAAAAGGDDIRRDTAISLDYRPDMRALLGEGAPVLDLTVDYVGDNFVRDIVGTGANSGPNLAASARLSYNLTESLSASLSGGYEWLNEPGFDRRFVGVSASQALGFASLSGSVRYSASEQPDSDDTQALLTLSIPFGGGHSSRAQYDLAEQSYRVDYDYRGDSGIGGFDASFSAVHDDGNVFPDAALTYRGNRGVVSVENDSLQIGAGDDRNVTRLSLASTVAYAGGDFAIGQPIGSAFALVSRHPSLSGRDVLIEPRDTGPEAVADWLPAVISLSPNVTNTVGFEVTDLPAGYDLGNSQFVFHPRAFSGTQVDVGKANYASALGTAVDPGGVPIALVGGQAEAQEDNSAPLVTTFTNTTGRFVLQGLVPGVRYRVTIGTRTAEVVIREAALGEVVQLGTVQFN